MYIWRNNVVRRSLIMVEKSISLFGKELFRVERNRLGEFTYSFLNGNDFNNSTKYLDISLTNPVLMTIIALRAKMYSQMEITHVNSKGDVIENSPYVNLLNNPNVFQSKEDFFFQQMWFLSATGNDYAYQIRAFKNEAPKALYNLIPSDIDFKDVQKVNKFFSTKEDWKSFSKKKIKYTLDNQEYNIEIGDLIPFYDMANGLSTNSFMQSESRVKGISKVLENIEQNIKSKNINLQMSQKYLGKNENTGHEGQIQAGDKQSIERAVVKNSLIVTNANIDVKHLVSDMKRLYLDEQFSQDALKCLLAFDMNKDVLNYFGQGSSTFENQEKGELRYLQNSIIPTANSTMNSFSSQWGLLEKGERLVASYNHLNIMQPIMNEKISSFKAMQETLKLAVELGTMDIKEAKQMSDEFKITIGL